MSTFLKFALRSLFLVVFGLPLMFFFVIAVGVPWVVLASIVLFIALSGDVLASVFGFANESQNKFDKYISPPLQFVNRVVSQTWQSIWHPTQTVSEFTPTASAKQKIFMMLGGLLLVLVFWWIVSHFLQIFIARATVQELPLPNLKNDGNAGLVEKAEHHNAGLVLSSQDTSEKLGEDDFVDLANNNSLIAGPIGTTETTPHQKPALSDEGIVELVKAESPQAATPLETLDDQRPLNPVLKETEVEQASKSLYFSKENPFMNSLGMQFVSVPGINVMFCIHETRVIDFKAFIKERGPRSNEPLATPLDRCPGEFPICLIAKSDAEQFCAWLSRHENRIYRLPTDREWSYAVGIGELEPESASPEEKDAKIENVYPWGNQFPPPVDVGNYLLKEVEDGFKFLAPVMSFKPNSLGIFDLGGNVCEWCSDKYRKNGTGEVIRGGGWFNFGREFCLSSQRVNPNRERDEGWGFRCVTETESITNTKNSK